MRIEALGEGQGEAASRVLLRVCDVAMPARPILFVLEPAGRAAGAALPDGWPAGEHEAASAKPSESGFEFVVGPDVMRGGEIPAGMAVAVRLPGIGLAGEVHWPRLETTQPKRARSIVVGRVQRARGEAARPKSAEDASGLPAGVAVAPPDAIVLRSVAPVNAGAQPTVRESLSQLVCAESADAGRATAGRDALTEADAPRSAALRNETTAVVPSVVAQGAVDDAPVTPMQLHLPDDAAAESASDAPRLPSMEPAASGGDASMTRRSGVGYASRIAAALALVAVTGGLLAFAASRFQHASARHATASSQASAAPATAPATAVPVHALFDALASGPTSPKGHHASGTSAEQALALAVPLMAEAGSDPDGQEGLFWLKHFVVSSLGDVRLQRALTRIGTHYAEPAKGPPDYVRARAIWELAGAAGDPVAMCFLGALFEHGLGVTASREAALQWLERARWAGGCRDLEAAVARLKG